VRAAARSRVPPRGEESGTGHRNADGIGAGRKRVKAGVKPVRTGCVWEIPRQFACPSRRLNTLQERVQAMSDLGRFHRILCPRGDLNPHRCYHPLAPQASASAYSATRTRCADRVGWLRLANLRRLREPIKSAPKAAASPAEAPAQPACRRPSQPRSARQATPRAHAKPRQKREQKRPRAQPGDRPKVQAERARRPAAKRPRKPNGTMEP
jgi:hypothetical protein